MYTIEELQKYKADLEATCPRDGAAFRELLDRGMLLLGLDETDVVRRFSINRGTLERWRNGLGSPHPVVRTIAYGWLREQCIEQLGPW